jgi:hypothetical protein
MRLAEKFYYAPCLSNIYTGYIELLIVVGHFIARLSRAYVSFKLGIDMAANMVIKIMRRLPTSMSAGFDHSYVPVALLGMTKQLDETSG